MIYIERRHYSANIGSRITTVVFVALMIAAIETPVGCQPQAKPAGKVTQRRIKKLESPHFTLSYDATKLTPAQVKEAQRLAEAGWSRCAELFKVEANPSVFGTQEMPMAVRKIDIDLSPSYIGSTAYMVPAVFLQKDSNPTDFKPTSSNFQRASIHFRYAELDYLGVKADYILTHEIAHVFSRAAIGSKFGLEQQPPQQTYPTITLDEGIADWAAGSFAGIPMRPWWGKALSQAGLWIDPDALFVHGNFEAPTAGSPQDLAARYAESALLVQFLVGRFGWRKFHEFHVEYSAARGPLNSNKNRRPQAIGQLANEQQTNEQQVLRPLNRQANTAILDPRDNAPNVEAVSTVFFKHFGLTWSQIRSEWDLQMEREPVPQTEAKRLILARQIYGAIREYEANLRINSQPSPSVHPSIRAAFVRCNKASEQGQIAQATQYLKQARELVKKLSPSSATK